MYWITGLLGILFVVAPFVLGYRTDSPALWSNIIVGLLVLIASAIKGFIPDDTRWEYFFAGVMAILGIIAPFVLGFHALTSALWASIILGVIVLILAGYEVISIGRHRTS